MNREDLEEEVKQEAESELNKASIEIASILNVGALKENDVVIFSILKPSPSLFQALGTLQERYGEELRNKNITLMVLGDGDKIETLNEKQMKERGWEKINRSRIIQL